MRNLVKKSLLPVKNSLPFPVFEKTKVLKANFSNFLLKYLKNLKKFEKNPLLLRVFGKIKVFKANFSEYMNFNLKNLPE